MTRKAGRPTEKMSAREDLITASRELFTVMAYEKVSTRLIAKRAGVNSALIRYYFGNKEGLFETMLRDTLLPMKLQVQAMLSQGSQKSFIDLMRVYYREMSQFPQFPRLVSQVMHIPSSETQRCLMEKVMADVTEPMQTMLWEKIASEGVIKPGVDPQLFRVSFVSLMVFPFIAPHGLLQLHGIDVNDDFLDRLLEHNIRLMKEGLFMDTSTATPFKNTESQCYEAQ